MARSLQRHLIAGGLAVLSVLLLAAAIQPSLVYDQFIWKYFWGPIVADAGTGMAVHNGVVAYAGYTLVSEIGYGLVLGYLLLVLVTVLKRFDVGTERGFVLAFIPFIAGGGLLRVLEDVAGATGTITPPLQYLLISPLIYGTMFAIVFGVLVLGVFLQRRGRVPDYRYVIAGGGTVFALLVLGALFAVADAVALWMIPASLGLAGAVLAAAYAASAVLAPRLIGAVFTAEGAATLYGHLLDGSSTALSFEVINRLADFPVMYSDKHPLVQFFIDTTGNAYYFILLKLVVIGGILYLMDDAVREDDPLFFNLVLLGILSIGMGPGVRNMTRAVFGV